MQVLDALSPIGARVKYETIAATSKAFRLCDLPRGPEHRAQQSDPVGPKLRQIPNVLIRNQHHMARSLRRDIAKGRQKLVLVNDLRLSFTTNDATENAGRTQSNLACAYLRSFVSTSKNSRLVRDLRNCASRASCAAVMS